MPIRQSKHIRGFGLLPEVEDVDVAISCPHCHHRIQLRGPKPGRFRPRCPQCGNLFMLVIPAEPGAAMQVSLPPSETLVTAGVAAKRSKSRGGTPAPSAPAMAGVNGHGGSNIFGEYLTNAAAVGHATGQAPHEAPP
ncbi:MAG TPA: hypothetical protein VLM40_19180, partial [Gemmata sp.]|nr:hypothetical protein [Gemmata sp.]